MSMELLLLGLMLFAACGTSCTLVESQPVVSADGNSVEGYATRSSIKKHASLPRRSCSQKSMQVNTAGMLAQIPNVDPKVACWATPFCNSMLTDFAYCYNMTGSMKDPNADDGRSEIYQHCLCYGRGDTYKE